MCSSRTWVGTCVLWKCRMDNWTKLHFILNPGDWTGALQILDKYSLEKPAFHFLFWYRIAKLLRLTLNSLFQEAWIYGHSVLVTVATGITVLCLQAWHSINFLIWLFLMVKKICAIYFHYNSFRRHKKTHKRQYYPKRVFAVIWSRISSYAKKNDYRIMLFWNNLFFI